MSSWIDVPREREILASKLHAEYRKTKHDEEEIDAAVDLEKIDNAWKDACESGKSNGKIRLCWLDLKEVSNRVYEFKSTYGRNLQELILDGIGLTTLEGICNYCVELTHLSVSCNHISDINISCIQNLSKLSHLNLLRNKLTYLPPTLGKLVNLTRLDVANNDLVELPNEIASLCRLKNLNLECNELSELPASFGRLMCEVVNLNSNNFAVFPDCVLNMPKLRQFSIMANALTDLPLGMGRLNFLEVFRASRNRINILPDSIVEIPFLTCLWLDYNRLSALPTNFFRLQRLKVLKLEGNVDMIYPPIDTIAMGTEEVLRWSRNRLQTKKTARVRHIVQSLEEVLSLVNRHRLGGDLHASLFLVNGDCYQFPPDALWSVFLPELRKIWSNPENTCNDGIKSFSFERHEVEKSLFEFRDAAGPIVKRLAKARFRRCSCMQTGHQSQVCIPPKVGWMCTRAALLVRMNVAYEENMREKRRLLEQDKRIDDAARTAEDIAKSFLESDDGMIMIHEEAERRISLRKRPKGLARTLSKKSIASGIHILKSQFGKSHQTEIRQIENEIKAEYISREVSKKKQQVMDANKKVVWIMKKWLGVTTDEVFRGWRDCVDVSKKQQIKEQKKRNKEERLRYEDEMATYELEKLKLMAWEQRWDEWQDATIWVNRDSNETRWEKPTPPMCPLPPKSLTDITTGKPYETDSSDKDSESCSSYDDSGYADSMSRAESLDDERDGANS